MAIYGYCRVSTVRQAEEGELLDVQERTIAGYALMHGLTVDRTFVERGVSGSKPLTDRPEGKALLTALKPGDMVITPKLDRMFRSALDALDVLAQLKAKGVSLHMVDLGGDVTGNGISKLVFTILSAVAEAERDRTRERVAEVKRDQKQRGRFLGGTVLVRLSRRRWRRTGREPRAAGCHRSDARDAGGGRVTAAHRRDGRRQPVTSGCGRHPQSIGMPLDHPPSSSGGACQRRRFLVFPLAGRLAEVTGGGSAGTTIGD